VLESYGYAFLSHLLRFYQTYALPPHELLSRHTWRINKVSHIKIHRFKTCTATTA